MSDTQHKEIYDLMNKHFADDLDFQKEIRKHFDDDVEFKKRMEPVIKAFENNKVVRIDFMEKTKTITFYVKSITTIGLAIAGFWAFLKWIILKGLI